MDYRFIQWKPGGSLEKRPVETVSMDLGRWIEIEGLWMKGYV
jgi:hypothetical protein